MFQNMNTDYQLLEVRERHARIRADMNRSRLFRDARGRHLFRSRQRRH